LCPANEVALSEDFAMTRTILFDSPFLLGFEHTRDLIERAAKAAAESYPPYNVEQSDDGGVRITLAVAGFSPDQLHVTVEGGQLVVADRRETDGHPDDGIACVYRGIAARGFLTTFLLPHGMEVTAATLEHGLLHVDLARPEPERLVRRIPIRSIG